MPDHNKVQFVGRRQLIAHSSQFHETRPQSGDKNKISWEISIVGFFLQQQQFSILLIWDVSILLKRGGNHNFPFLSIVVKSTTELKPIGNPFGLSCLDLWKFMPDAPSSDPDCCDDERVGMEMCQQTPAAPWEAGQGDVPADPYSSHIQISYNHKTKFLRCDFGILTHPTTQIWGKILKPISKTTNIRMWYLIFTLTIFVFPSLLMRWSTSVYIYWPFGYSLLWSAGLSLAPIFLLMSMFILTWELFISLSILNISSRFVLCVTNTFFHSVVCFFSVNDVPWKSRHPEF